MYEMEQIKRFNSLLITQAAPSPSQLCGLCLPSRSSCFAARED
jgi:hypothetical protein